MGWLSRSAWLRLFVVTALSAVLFGCGGNGTGSPASGGNNGTNNGGGGNSGGGGGSTTIVTHLHLYTSLCDLPSGCPADEKPYRVNVSIEQQRTNGWVLVTDTNGIDTGLMGEVLIGLSEAGTYRIKALPVQPSTTTRNGTAPDASVTLINNLTTDLKIQFTPF